MTLGICGVLLALVLVMRLAPRSPAAQVLHRQLVERPLAWLCRLERHQLIFVLIMAGFIALGGEIIALLGPELVAAYTLDAAIYLDLLAVACTLFVMTRVRGAARAVKWQVERALARLGARRPRARARCRVTRRWPAANDDDEEARPLAA